MNNDSFVSNAQALLDLDKDGALVPHGIGGHARSLLEYAIAALAVPQAPLQAEPAPVVASEPLTDRQIEKLREETFSTTNPFCPVDSKSMRKAVRAAERAHGIKGECK